MQVDVVVVGAGPAGLCFARSLAGSGLSVAVVEKQPLQAVAAPGFDGREIALTHASRAILAELGLWQRFDAADVSDLRNAQVSDGESPHPLRISAADGRRGQLGWLVPNHVIRQAAFEAVHAQEGLELLAGSGAEDAYNLEQVLNIAIDRSEALGLYLRGSQRDALPHARWLLGSMARLFGERERPELNL